MARPGGTAPVYSYAELEGLWIRAAEPRLGKTRAYALAPLMAAIAEAESGGNPNAYNPDDNDGTQSSFGLWQVSTGTHAPPSPQWADPAVNAQLAVGTYQGQGLKAWGTYDSGAYRAYLSSKTTPDFRLAGNPTAQGANLAAKISQSGSACAIRFPSVNVPVVPLIYTQTVGGFCLVSKAEMSRLAGAALMVAGIAILLVPIQIFATGKILQIVLPVAKNRATSAVRSLVPGGP